MRLRSGTRFEGEPNDSEVKTKRGRSKSQSPKKSQNQNGEAAGYHHHEPKQKMEVNGSVERNGVTRRKIDAKSFDEGDGIENVPRVVPPAKKTQEIRDHAWWVMLLMKLGCTFLVVMYFVIPTIIRFNPWLLAEGVFLHRLRWPPSIDLNRPEDVGLNYTYNFQIPSTDDVVLGAWHTLPSSLHSAASKGNNAALLRKGDPIMLYLHGNAGTRSANHRVQLYRLMANHGFHVVAVDYRGFADSSGSPNETGVVEDAFAAYKWVKEHRSSNASVYIWGHSLGTAVATKLAQRLSEGGEPYGALILEAPFNSLMEAALTHPISLPFRYMPYFPWVFVEPLKGLDIAFESDKNIVGVKQPILIIHAKDDGIVPFQLGEKLYEAAKSSGCRVTFHTLEAGLGYGHKHIHKAPELMSTVREFIKAAKPKKS